MNDDFPGDYNLLSRWFNIIRAARASGKSAGYAIVRISVLVDERGNPLAWGDIKAERLHPQNSKDFLSQFIDKF